MSNEGFFINENDEPILAEAEPGEPFPIMCGPWPNVHAGAIRRMCSCCADSIGVSPKGLAMHDAYPDGRPLLCNFCFGFLKAALRRMS